MDIMAYHAAMSAPANVLEYISDFGQSLRLLKAEAQSTGAHTIFCTFHYSGPSTYSSTGLGRNTHTLGDTQIRVGR